MCDFIGMSISRWLLVTRCGTDGLVPMGTIDRRRIDWR
jgi:hypothetical protein